MNMFIAMAAVSSVAGGALAQDFEIALVAPMTVDMGETYTIEAWGSVTGDQWVDGISAMAGFGISAFATEGANLVVTNHGSVISEWAAGFGTDGIVVGSDLLDVSGGQLANLIPDLNPNLDLSNPIMLFTFDVTVGDTTGAVTYTPGNPNPNGGLSFYPDSEDGQSIIALNTPGTTLTLTGVTTRVVPAPATLALVGLAGLATGRRRGANSKTDD
jgi:hypothetical protein